MPEKVLRRYSCRALFVRCHRDAERITLERKDGKPRCAECRSFLRGAFTSEVERRYGVVGKSRETMTQSQQLWFAITD